MGAFGLSASGRHGVGLLLPRNGGVWLGVAGKVLCLGEHAMILRLGGVGREGVGQYTNIA